MKFRLLSGRHQGPGVRNQPQDYEKGDVVESNEQLDVLFPNKFKRVKESVPATPKKEIAKPVSDRLVPEEPASEDFDDGKEDEENAVNPLGRDVTDDFEGVVASGMKVFRGGTKNHYKYWVVEGGFPDKPLNDEPLKRSEIPAFIESQMEGA